MKKLKIYIDEGGDFGLLAKSSELYIVSFVIYDTSVSINNDISYLNNKLKNIGYNGMIHTTPLIAKRDEYKEMNYEVRKKIFLTLFFFCTRVNIKLKSIIIDKKFNNNKETLKNNLKKEIEKMYINNLNYFSKFDLIEIYYDNGQINLTRILCNVFKSNPKIVFIKDFNHEKERLFQVADLLTNLDKYIYKRKRKIKLNKNELYFFNSLELKKHLLELKNKRL